MGSRSGFHQSPTSGDGVIDGIPDVLIGMVAHDRIERVDRVPARIDGVWQGTAGDGAMRIEVRQRYQRVSGRVTKLSWKILPAK